MKKLGLKQRNLTICVGISIIIMAYIAVCLFDFSQKSNINTRNMVMEHLEDVENQVIYAAETKLEDSLETVKYTASLLSEIPGISEEGVALALERMQDKCSFSRINIMDDQGRVYTLDGREAQSGTYEYVENLMEGRSGITRRFTSGITGEEVFGIYAPLTRENRVTGGIVGIMVVNDLVDLVQSVGFQSRSYSYLIEPDGNMIMQSNHRDSLYQGRDLFSFLEMNADRISVTTDELRQSMERGERGFFVCSFGEEERIACYAPTRINDWYAITVVSAEVTDQYLFSVERSALQLTMKLALVFLISVALVILWMRKTQDMILTAKEEAELINKKFEQALAHTSNLVFEYSPHSDEIRFMSTAASFRGKLQQRLPNVSENAVQQGLVAPGYTGEFQRILEEIRRGEPMAAARIQGGSVFGEDIWFYVSITAIENASGEMVEAIGTMEDVTVEVRTKRRCIQEERYREAVLKDALTVWSVDLVKQKLLTYTLRGADRLKERELDYSEALVERMCGNVHPEDRGRILKFMKAGRMLTAYCAGTKRLKETFRVKLPGDSDYRWVACTVNLIRETENGRPIALAFVKDVDEERKRVQALTYTSERDPLTGVYNRRSFEKRVNEFLTRNPGHPACLLMLDLDGFKQINDHFGHKAGDDILKAVGEILKTTCGAENLSARLGGDEFAVFLGSPEAREEALAYAGRVCRAVREIKSGDGWEIEGISVSIGIAYAPEYGGRFETLYQNADKALYVAKRQGKNQASVYGEEWED